MSASRPILAHPPIAADPLLEVVGTDLEVPIIPSGSTRFVHLDIAASAPALRSVATAVADFLPWYSSVHRGAGFTSTVSSEALRDAREVVAASVGARSDDVVVFTRNTTDSLNLLARSLPPGTRVLTLDLEHHANLLPWRTGSVTHLPTPRDVGAIPGVFAQELAALDADHTVVAITGASNVTGEVLPIADIAAVAHRWGARVVLDAAQLAPHRRVDIAALGVDYVAYSGHKMYAPFGAGVLVGRSDWLDEAEPYLAGGGAGQLITVDDAVWHPSPARHEGGTPNVVGAVAIAAAYRSLADVGFDLVEEHDAALTHHLLDGLSSLPVEVLSAFDDADRVGIVALTSELPANLVAAALSAEHGIATRDGAFCAHPLLRRLTGVGPADPLPSALRVSVGVGTTLADIDRLLDALGTILGDGPRASYAVLDGRLAPAADTRPRPPVALSVVPG